MREPYSCYVLHSVDMETKDMKVWVEDVKREKYGQGGFDSEPCWSERLIIHVYFSALGTERETRELERDLVPEWRAKYLDYKIGKKKVKAIARALRTVNQTPKTPARHAPTSLLAGAAYQSPTRTRDNSDALRVDSQHLGPTPISTPVATPNHEQANASHEHNWGTHGGGEAGKHSPTKATPTPIKKNTPFETSTRDSSTAWDSGAITNYGSF
ncbi:MAG: hypothetical protein Q9198_000787, partial [Flavoplaca austrocitrina]